LHLHPTTLRNLARQGHATPTPIQARAIPGILAGRDLCAIAQTGTGKTGAFALPILTRLADRHARTSRSPRVLVLAPTRELASQVEQTFRLLGAGLGLSTATVFGGVSQHPQVAALRRGVDILVATPGRLLDLLGQRAVSLAAVEILVVDEADQMLDLGFFVPLTKIVKLTPAERQTLFFSATMPKAIAELAGSLLRDPLRVSVAPAATPIGAIAQRVAFVSDREKPALLVALLADEDLRRVLVFTRTKRGSDRVARNLAAARIDAAVIHGNKSQGQRERALAAFKDGSVRVLVATDIAARGIHIDGISHVVNYELPNVPESYVHRIGRTGRAGAGGTAVSFCSETERPLLRDIERLTRMPIPVAPQSGAGGSDPRAMDARPPRQTAARPTTRGGERKQQHASPGRRDRPQANHAAASLGLPAFLVRPTPRQQQSSAET
jgi:ATP-dependent RNA helicase RhlE